MKRGSGIAIDNNSFLQHLHEDDTKCRRLQVYPTFEIVVGICFPFTRAILIKNNGEITALDRLFPKSFNWFRDFLFLVVMNELNHTNLNTTGTFLRIPVL